MSEKKNTQQFTIESITPRASPRGPRVEVAVSYPGGAKVFDFPSHFGQALIIAQVRQGLRAELSAAAMPTDKYTALIGSKHDL